MKTILICDDITSPLQEIYLANEPIIIDFIDTDDIDVFSMIAIHNAIKNCEYETIARVDGIASLIPVIGADKIKLADNGYVYIIPIFSYIDESWDDEQKEWHLKMLDKANAAIRKLYENYPKIQALFDDGKNHWLSKEDLIELGLNII